MRCLFAAAIAAALLVPAAFPAHAEKRIFIVANDPDGYGVDRCLASGSACGAAAASAYCRSRQFAQAVAFRKVDRDDITGIVPASTNAGCRAGSCEEFVAIECAR